jgi:Tectonin domain/Papain family cysteine protease
MDKRCTIPLSIAGVVMLMVTSGCALDASTLPARATATVARTHHGEGFSPNKQAQPVPQVAFSGQLPAQVDLSAFNPPVSDQGTDDHACTSWAVGYYLRGWYAMRDGHYPASSRSGLAPMYLYAQIVQGQDIPTTFLDNLKILITQGIDTRGDYLQGDLDGTSQPTDAERTNAARYKIMGFEDYRRTSTSAGQAEFKSWIESTLAGGAPIVIGFPVYDEFAYAKAASSFVTVPKNTGSLQGGHASFAYGYDERGLLIENSWGTDWGNGGFAELSWDFVTQYAIEVASLTPASEAVWEQLPGSATDISVGANGDVWAVGTTPVPGGFNIERWNASTWTWNQVVGGAVHIAVGSDGNPWIVTSSGDIYHLVGGWQHYPGAARDIAVASDGTPWIVGKSSVLTNQLAARVASSRANFAAPPPGPVLNPDDGGIYRWIYNGWQQIPGGANRITVSGIYPWVVSSSGAIIQRWGIDLLQRPLPSSATDIGCTNDSIPRNCWIVGIESRTATAQVSVYSWNGSGWDLVPAPGPGGGEAISVGPRGSAWVIDSSGHVFELPAWGDF